MIAQFGWEAMTLGEQVAVVGGVVAFLSFVAAATTAWISWQAMKKQVKIATEANTTAKISVENQARANEITKLSVDDQIKMNQLARSAAVRIAETEILDAATSRQNGDLDAIPWFYEGKPPPEDYPVMTMTLINEGMGSAYNIRLIPISVEGVTLTPHLNFGWRMIKEGQSLHDALDPFASVPIKTFMSIPPGNTAEFKVAVRLEAFRLAMRGYFLQASYKLAYEDSIGTREKCFQFGNYLASRRSRLRATEIACTGEPQA